LLKIAEGKPLSRLREACRRVTAAAETDDVSRYEVIRRSRHLRHWTEGDGAFRLDARLCPDAGADVLAALRPHLDEAVETARRQGRRESPEALAADALVALARGGASGPRAKIQLRVDHAAWVRGHTEAGETCEIEGVGPIPVATARGLGNDAIVSAVVVGGSDVTTVAHLGRRIPAHLRTALEARDPMCVVPGCGHDKELETDHIVPWAEGGPTRLDNLARLCRWHHYLKTHRRYRLCGEPGRWRWEPPDATAQDRAPPGVGLT
jgi:hypothetical protein